MFGQKGQTRVAFPGPIDLDILDEVLIKLYGAAPQGGYLVTIKENEWRDEDLKRYEGNGEDLLDG